MKRETSYRYPQNEDGRVKRSSRSDSSERERYPERERRAPPQKSRRGQSVFSNTMLYLLMVVGISAILAVFGWSLANDVLALDKGDITAVISVQDENDFDSVVDQLKDGGIIRYKFMFRLFSAFADGESKISVGTYEINTSMDYRAIISNMGSSSSSRMVTSVTIPEGYTVAQIFSLLEEKGVSTVAKLEETAATHNYAFSFLQDIPLGSASRLEGYLFPDTYEFYMGEDPLYVINKMLCNFDEKMTDERRQQITDMGYTMYDIITIASMIEKETDGSDRKLISSVIYNRLNHPYGETAGLLQIDATIQYVLPEGQTVTEADYDSVDSPYNTYRNKGLPPGPISNPGMESIVAAMNPEVTGYYFYALGTDKTHHYFNTYREFQNFLNN